MCQVGNASFWLDPGYNDSTAYHWQCYADGVGADCYAQRGYGSFWSVDNNTCTVHGWACDRNNGNVQTTAYLYEWKDSKYQYVAPTTANLGAGDNDGINKACGSSGVGHNFSYALPESFHDGNPHYLVINGVLHSGTQYNLPLGAPAASTPDRPGGNPAIEASIVCKKKELNICSACRAGATRYNDGNIYPITRTTTSLSVCLVDVDEADKCKGTIADSTTKWTSDVARLSVGSPGNPTTASLAPGSATNVNITATYSSLTPVTAKFSLACTPQCDFNGRTAKQICKGTTITGTDIYSCGKTCTLAGEKDCDSGWTEVAP